MALKDDLSTHVKSTFRDLWSTRDGIKVPEPENVKLSNDAVKLTGTVLYADLADSTNLVRNYTPQFAAEVYKSYLYCAARLISYCGGTVTAYDGDRVMAVFIGDRKNSLAAKCALHINWVVREIIQPAMNAQYTNNSFALKQKVGIDTSDLFIARTGVRGTNDLVWVGNAANYAAKMAALDTTYPTYISASVYSMLLDTSKYGGDPKRDMWTDLGSRHLGFKIYGSTWWWGL